jgi:hypothetical protein
MAMVALVRSALRRWTVIALFNIFAIGIAVPSTPDSENDWQTHTDEELKVAFRCPKEWKQDRQVYRDRTYLEGRDQHNSYLGYVQLIASGGDSPEQICREEATHKAQPYGAHPQIRSLKIQGQRACLVSPSEEQGQEVSLAGGPVQYRPGMNADALLVVEYPRGIKIDGLYGQLWIIADKNHILQIGRTIRFLRSADQGRADKAK